MMEPPEKAEGLGRRVPPDEPGVEEGMIAKATALVERQEAANKVTAELVERQEKLKVQDMLGGTTIAGQPVVKPKEETPEEYAARIVAND